MSNSCVIQVLVVSTSVAMRSGIATVSTRSGLMESAIASGRAERRRKDTENDGTGRKRRDATSPLAGMMDTQTDTLPLGF